MKAKLNKFFENTTGAKMNKNYTTIKSTIYDCLKTVILLTISTIISYMFAHVTKNDYNITAIFILAVSIISRFTNGYIYGIVSSFFGAFIVNDYFTYPQTKLNTSVNEYIFTLIGMIIISLIVSIITSHTKEKVRQAFEREEKNNKQNKLLNKLNTQLLSSNGLTYIIDLSLEYISEFVKSTVVFYQQSPQSGNVGTPGNSGIMKCWYPTHEKQLNSYHEHFIAHWVFENKIPAGVGTDFCGESSCIYLPLISHDNIWGVLGIYCSNQKPLEEKKLNFLYIMLSQVAMCIERQHLSDNQQYIMVENEKEKMRANLLRAVSHDLRTPLTGMIGISETLLQNKNFLSEDEKDKLIGYINEDSNWLLHMVENLLSVTRIREGNSSVNKVPEPLEEVVSDAIMRVKKRYPEAQIHVRVPDDFLMVPMDATLIEQVIMNLIENSLKHSQSSKPIEFYVTAEESCIRFNIIDQGIGIMVDRLETIFDGYSQTENQSSDTTKGIGIGLSICKAIVNAHGGTISASNQSVGGVSFTFTLPVDQNKE